MAMIGAADPAATRARDHTRARQPDRTGVVDSGGVPIAWEVHGSGSPTFLLLPTWTIVHSRLWKLQVPYLARHARVVTFDPRGNGGSGRPAAAEAYDERAFAADIVAVMDATATAEAVLVSLSRGAHRALLVAAEHPERVSGAVFIGPALALAPASPERALIGSFDDELPTDSGWAKYNRHYWLRDYRGFLEFFFEECFSEPHSTKPIEDCVEWGGETDPDTLILTQHARGLGARDRVLEIASSIRCPVLVIHGDDDRIIPHAVGVELAKATGGRMETIAGGGHIPNARDPVRVNLLLRDFARSLPAGGTG